MILPRTLRVFLLLTLFVVGVYAVRSLVPAPDLVAMESPWRPLDTEAQLLIDTSWTNESGERVLKQELFDTILEHINRAEQFILVDWFLFNDWQGPAPETYRALTKEFTDALVAVKSARPELTVVVITDPVNEVYGGVVASHLESLKDAGVLVVMSPLVELQDSNPVFSAVWRGLVRPFGNSTEGGWLPNPFGDGDVTLRSYLALLNFKANHRKLVITDSTDGGYHAVVSSANPHDGSSAHRNIGLAFGGLPAVDLLQMENRLLRLATDSNAHTDMAMIAHGKVQSILDNQKSEVSSTSSPPEETSPSAQMRIVSESAIRRAVVAAIDTSSTGDEVDLLMFYLSHRGVVDVLKRAAARGVAIRVLLDANKDAFGREKGGIPNRPVAAELVAAGIDVRWCATQGEQCHAKAVMVKQGDTGRLILGSGNYTRRNLDDYNLETNVDIRGSIQHPVLVAFGQQFDLEWSDDGARTFSLEYDAFADGSLWKTLLYRVTEATGLSTF